MSLVIKSGLSNNTATVDANGNLQVTLAGTGAAGAVNQGSANTNTNGWPVKITDGTNVLGTSANPLDVQSGATGAAAPANALEAGQVAATALPTAVTGGQLVGAMGDKFGRGIVMLNAMRDLIGTASVQSTSAVLATLIAAGAAGVFNDIVTLILTNESATATIVSISDGTTTYKIAIAANGGAVVNFPTPLPATSSATAWQVSNSAAVNVDCIAVYVKNK